MADPLSITTGVLALLGACISVVGTIKDIQDGAAIVEVKVKGLLSDVESFEQVLQMMKDTLEDAKVKSSLQATGHIGNHWNNLSTTIKDGKNTLINLQNILDKANKTVSFLDSPRKHLRLKGATEQIAMFQQQIRSYRDTIQLSLQTVILWNQVTFKESTDKILPNLDELHDSIRRIAFDINARMLVLQTLVESSSKTEQVQALTNLRNCVQSAATVVSSASTTLGIEQPDHFSVTYGSEFGDCFPSQPSATILRWVSSNTVYEFEEDLQQSPTRQDVEGASGKKPQQVSDANEGDQSDSDNDLEVEIVKALLRKGKERLDAKDFEGAERPLRICLTRTTRSVSPSTFHHAWKTEAMEHLVEVYQQQQKWTEAQFILIEKISLGSRGTADDNSDVLLDILTLVQVLLNKEAYSEALLYGRRALKGYRRIGHAGMLGVTKSLQLLIEICHAEGNVDEEEAYTAVLSSFTEQQESKMRQLVQEQRPLADEGYIAPDSDTPKLRLPSPGGPEPGQILIVVHNFSARSSDELTISRGDRIELISRDDYYNDGWYLGRHLANGMSGIFPEVYTRIVPRGL